jgi:peptide/nickel transport system substrate-binding protein
VKVTALPSDEYWKIWSKEETAFAFTTWAHRPLGVMTLALAYRTGAPWNESRFSNPRFDALLTQAEGLLDVEQRRAVMKDIESLMQEEGPIVQPLWRSLFTVMDKRVKGFRIHPTQYIFCEEWSWEA